MTRKMVEGNHYSLPLFLYLLFFLINLCPPPVFLLYERRANTWRDLRAAELDRFNILILVYCPAAQSQTRWLYWHVLLRWHSDELARSKGKRRWELGEREKMDLGKERKSEKEKSVCSCMEFSITPLLKLLNSLHLRALHLSFFSFHHPVSVT